MGTGGLSPLTLITVQNAAIGAQQLSHQQHHLILRQQRQCNQVGLSVGLCCAGITPKVMDKF